MASHDIERMSAHFDAMYREGITPWEEYGMEPHIPFVADLLLRERSEPFVLDLGCGTGWVSVYFAERGIRVEGIDSSPTAIAEAKERAHHHHVEDRVQFRVGNALEFLYPDMTFHAVYDRGFFHHVPEQEYPRYLTGVQRVLKPGGVLSLSVFSAKNPVGIGHRFEQHDLEAIFGQYFAFAHFASDPYPTNAPAHLHHAILRKR